MQHQRRAGTTEPSSQEDEKADVVLTEQQPPRRSMDDEQQQEQQQRILYQRQRVDGQSHDSVLQAIDYMQHFLTHAKHNTLSHEIHSAHPLSDGTQREETKDIGGGEEQKEQPDEEAADERVELTRLMDALADRPELIRWAAERSIADEEDARNEEQDELHSRPPDTPSRLLPLAARMRQESTLFASRRRPLLSSGSQAAPMWSSSHSSFSLLSAAERRLCSRRLSSLQRQLADEAKQRRTTQHTLQARMAEDDRTRRAALKRVESAAVERTMSAAMGRNRRDERELERMVAEQADRVRQLIGMKREGMRSYYREQLGLVQEERGRQQHERTVQERALKHALRRCEREEMESRASNLGKIRELAAQVDDRARLHAEQDAGWQSASAGNSMSRRLGS